MTSQVNQILKFGGVALNFDIYFDESNKLDQPNGEHYYYGSLGMDGIRSNCIEGMDSMGDTLPIESNG